MEIAGEPHGGRAAGAGAWRCAGVRVHRDAPAWAWSHPAHGVRTGGPLRLGDDLALAVPPGADRRCAGVTRAGRLTPCPRAAELPRTARRDQCEDCATLDRSRSVAADTVPDDPRPYAVYLAWFAPGVTKVGITAAERGAARLLEQAAVCFTFLGHGPLMAARRAESVLGAALGVPDRIPTGRKHPARLALPPAPERAAELRELYEAALMVRDGTLTPAPFAPVDHAERFGLEPEPPRPAARITELSPGSAVRGTLRAAAGSDLYLATPDGELLLDARLAAGWPLLRAHGRERPAETERLDGVEGPRLF